MLLKEDSNFKCFHVCIHMVLLLCYCNTLKTTVAAHLGQDAYEKKKKKRFIISESLFSGKVFFLSSRSTGHLETRRAAVLFLPRMPFNCIIDTAGVSFPLRQIYNTFLHVIQIRLMRAA